MHYYVPARREGGSKRCFCPSVRLLRTERIIREPKGLACQNLEVRFPTLDATRIPVLRSNSRRSGSPDPLMLTHIVRHIFRMPRPTNFKLGERMENDDPPQPQEPRPPRGQRSRSRGPLMLTHIEIECKATQIKQITRRWRSYRDKFVLGLAQSRSAVENAGRRSPLVGRRRWLRADRLDAVDWRSSSTCPLLLVVSKSRQGVADWPQVRGRRATSGVLVDWCRHDH